jgi:DNA-binding PadR family transcriptional regulator
VSSQPIDPHAELSASVSAGLARLDDLLEHRSRLAACVLLSRADQLSFSRLKQLLNETDGNLGAQLRKLEEAGYIAVRKTFERRRPVSWYRLTPNGHKALVAHVEALDRLIGRPGR